MTKRERVKHALSHKETDFTPYNIELTSEAMRRFAAHTGVAAADFAEFAGNHIEKLSCNGGSWIKDGYFKDEWGVVWNRTVDKDIGVVEKYELPNANFDGYTFPEPDLKTIEARVKALSEDGRGRFKLAKVGVTLFERAWSLRGMENLMYDMYDDEAFVSELTARITDHNLKIVECALGYDVDGFYFGDDYGSQAGLMFSDALWRKYIKPNLSRLFKPIKARGLAIAFHSCGDISKILPDMVEIGLDCYQTVQPEIYDLEKLKAGYAGRLAFWGAVSTQQFLPTARPGEIAPLVKKTIGILGKGGGYICGPTHQVPHDVPPENITALISFLKNQN